MWHLRDSSARPRLIAVCIISVVLKNDGNSGMCVAACPDRKRAAWRRSHSFLPSSRLSTTHTATQAHRHAGTRARISPQTTHRCIQMLPMNPHLHSSMLDTNINSDYNVCILQDNICFLWSLTIIGCQGCDMSCSYRNCCVTMLTSQSLWAVLECSIISHNKMIAELHVYKLGKCRLLRQIMWCGRRPQTGRKWTMWLLSLLKGCLFSQIRYILTDMTTVPKYC